MTTLPAQGIIKNMTQSEILLAVTDLQGIIIRNRAFTPVESTESALNAIGSMEAYYKRNRS